MSISRLTAQAAPVSSCPCPVCGTPGRRAGRRFACGACNIEFTTSRNPERIALASAGLARHDAKTKKTAGVAPDGPLPIDSCCRDATPDSLTFRVEQESGVPARGNYTSQ